MTSFDFFSLDFTIFLKIRKITEINIKSIQNGYQMYKFVNICNLTKNTVIQIQKDFGTAAESFSPLEYFQLMGGGGGGWPVASTLPPI